MRCADPYKCIQLLAQCIDRASWASQSVGPASCCRRYLVDAKAVEAIVQDVGADEATNVIGNCSLDLSRLVAGSLLRSDASIQFGGDQGHGIGRMYSHIHLQMLAPSAGAPCALAYFLMAV